LGEDAEVDGCDVLVATIDDRGSVLHEFEDVKLFDELGTEFVANLLFNPLALLFNVQTHEVDVVFCLPAGEPCNANFRCWGWWEAFDARDFDLVFTNLFDLDVCQVCGDVAVVV
jgi:hypothetical protein